MGLLKWAEKLQAGLHMQSNNMHIFLAEKICHQDVGLFKFFGVMIVWRISVGSPDFCFNISTMLANTSREFQFIKQLVWGNWFSEGLVFWAWILVCCHAFLYRLPNLSDPLMWSKNSCIMEQDLKPTTSGYTSSRLARHLCLFWSWHLSNYNTMNRCLVIRDSNVYKRLLLLDWSK